MINRTRGLAVSVLVLALVAAACSDNGGDTTTTTTSPAPISTSTAPDQPADDPAGPLAVVLPAEGSDGALIQGTLRITNECVLLDERGDEVLLVWPGDRASWDPDTRTIAFQAGDGVVTLADGDEVTFGGGGSSADEGGLRSEDWVATVPWVSEPDPACLRDIRWFIGELVDLPG